MMIKLGELRWRTICGVVWGIGSLGKENGCPQPVGCQMLYLMRFEVGDLRDRAGTAGAAQSQSSAVAAASKFMQSG